MSYNIYFLGCLINCIKQLNNTNCDIMLHKEFCTFYDNTEKCACMCVSYDSVNQVIKSQGLLIYACVIVSLFLDNKALSEVVMCNVMSYVVLFAHIQ